MLGWSFQRAHVPQVFFVMTITVVVITATALRDWNIHCFSLN